jgi:hypothetical protein
MRSHDMPYGSRHRTGHRAVVRRDASGHRGDAITSGSRSEVPALHGDGRDHIGGGGRTPAARPGDRIIALADGTRITFATAGVTP